MSDPNVAPGQLWYDNDPRAAGRVLRVDTIRQSDKGMVADCTIVADPKDCSRTRVGKKTTIAVRRFRPTSTGYRIWPDWIAVLGYVKRWTTDGRMIKSVCSDIRPGTPLLNATGTEKLGEVISLETTQCGALVAQGTLLALSTNLADLIPEAGFTSGQITHDQRGTVLESVHLGYIRASSTTNKLWPEQHFEIPEQHIPPPNNGRS